MNVNNYKKNVLKINFIYINELFCQLLVKNLIISGVQISFRCFWSKIGHLLWRNGTLYFIRSIVHRIVLLAFGMNLDPIMLPIPHLRTLSAFHYVLCLRCIIHRSWTSETTHDNFFHLRQPHHVFLQAIDAPQMQISSNWRSKSKVPANDAYSAQNLTFSHTKEYIILMKIH